MRKCAFHYAGQPARTEPYPPARNATPFVSLAHFVVADIGPSDEECVYDDYTQHANTKNIDDQ